MFKPRREILKKGRDHLTVTNEFQSDKYSWCPAGFVPIKVTDPTAREFLLQYAERRKPIDPEFTRDLKEAVAEQDKVNWCAICKRHRNCWWSLFKIIEGKCSKCGNLVK